MTWEQLAARIAEMTPEQRQTNVTLIDFDTSDNEVYPLNNLEFNDEGKVTDVLDEDHPFFALSR